MATSVIEQKPFRNTQPVGQEVIFVVSNEDAVANEQKVKFGVEVHISSTTIPNTSVSDDLIGTFKATPNNAGVGIFDFRSIIENYVKADNMAANGSAYKTTTTDDTTPHPLHLIDKYSKNNHILRYMVLQFFVEYLGADDGVNPVDPNVVVRATGTHINSEPYRIWNGYLKYTDLLSIETGTNNFGYDFTPLNLTGSTKSFLTNSPTTQYADVNDYGTFGFINPLVFQDDPLDAIAKIRFTYSLNDGSTTNETIDLNEASGAYETWAAQADEIILYFGAFPGNLQNWSAAFQGYVAAGTIQGGSYTVQAQNSANAAKSQAYTINVNCPDTKNFEVIRLCWMNQWGTWDHYTFTQKSIRTISTSGSTYQQLGGTWNQSRYTVDSYKGGTKQFRVNATESIKINTDFISEDDNVMFEELMNSPEIYQLTGFTSDASESALNTYVIPVRMKSSSFTKKTIANDRLMQYTFDIEKTKTLRTQSV